MTDVLFKQPSRRAGRISGPLLGSHDSLSARSRRCRGLMSYGASIPDLYINIGRYGRSSSQGRETRDLPVLRPTKIELVIT